MWDSLSLMIATMWVRVAMADAIPRALVTLWLCAYVAMVYWAVLYLLRASQVILARRGVWLVGAWVAVVWALACGAATVFGPAEAEPMCQSATICSPARRP